jgi:hypothetical protein
VGSHPGVLPALGLLAFDAQLPTEEVSHLAQRVVGVGSLARECELVLEVARVFVASTSYRVTGRVGERRPRSRCTRDLAPSAWSTVPVIAPGSSDWSPRCTSATSRVSSTTSNAPPVPARAAGLSTTQPPELYTRTVPRKRGASTHAANGLWVCP